MTPETKQMIDAARPVIAEIGTTLETARDVGFPPAALLLAIATTAGWLVAEVARTNSLPPDDVRTMFNRMVDNAQAGSLAQRAAATRN